MKQIVGLEKMGNDMSGTTARNHGDKELEQPQDAHKASGDSKISEEHWDSLMTQVAPPGSG